jgi:hypothetical protein
MKKVVRLTERDLTRLIKRIIREEEEITNEDRIKEFLNSNEVKQDTSVWSFTTCDEDEWERVQRYIIGSGKQSKFSNPTGKQVFLSRNEKISEEEFDSVYYDWVDNIETDRGFEQMNQDDFNY